MKRLIRYVGILALFLPHHALAEFCTIDRWGNVGMCFPTADICRSVPNLGGGCIFRQGGNSSGGNSGSSDLDKAMGTLREIGKSRQREANELRANTPAFLLPLSSEPMSRETVVIITSTLNTALEMDGPRTPRTWKNPTTGSQGLVFAEVQKTSQYGSVCREFIVIMDSNGKRTGVKGNACRAAEEWKIPGSTPVEFRDGKIVEPFQASAISSSVNPPKVTENSDQTSRSGSPSGTDPLDRGKLMEYLQSVGWKKVYSSQRGDLFYAPNTLIIDEGRPQMWNVAIGNEASQISNLLKWEYNCTDNKKRLRAKKTFNNERADSRELMQKLPAHVSLGAWQEVTADASKLVDFKSACKMSSN